MEEKILEVQNLTKIYGKGKIQVQAVNDVSFVIHQGEIVLIIGPSGSGKTTLLTMIGGILKPTSGKIFIKGQEITKLSEKELPKFRRENIGFIFQNFSLLESLTAKENVEVALRILGKEKKEAENKARKLLENLGLKERLNYLPSKLSGGEKQRVAIARALAFQPILLLADEPTANLDSKTGHQIVEILRDIAKIQKKTVIIVSHDMRILDIADRIFWLEDGKVKEAGMMVIVDPVCQMKLERENAPYSSEIGGKIYYFCSKICQETFEKNPEKFK